MGVLLWEDRESWVIFIDKGKVGAKDSKENNIAIVGPCQIWKCSTNFGQILKENVQIILEHMEYKIPSSRFCNFSYHVGIG